MQKITLTHVIRDEVSVPVVVTTFGAGQQQYIDHVSVEDELIPHAVHTHQL